MMKKLFAVCFIVLAVTSTIAMDSESPDAKRGKSVEISFDYERKQGPGSNQFAVWVENEKGEVIKTLFVTSFTAKGRVRGNEPARRGYTFRPACVPTWVKHANAANITDEEIDGFTGATPQSGKQVFVWDFTDTDGKMVTKGEYKVCVEATLKNEYRMLFIGRVSTKGKAGNIPVDVTETQADEAYVGMIKAVNITVKQEGNDRL